MTDRPTEISTGQEDKPEKHLYRKVVHGGAWVFVLRCSQQVLALVRLVIITKILTPSEYGILGIALITMTITKIVTETGFDAALVQRKGNIKPYLNAAWSVHVLRNIFLFGLIFTGAPYVIELLNNPNEPIDVSTATCVLRVIAITFLLSGFSNIGTVHFRKDMEFNKFFLQQVSGTLVDAIVAITLLILCRNIWALVWGKLAGQTVQFILSYVLHPHRPRFRFDWPKIQELWDYGKWGLGMAVIGFLITEGDDLMVAKILGPTMMGLYIMAHKIGWLPITEVALTIANVTFPAYAKVQDNIPRLRNAFLKVMKFTAFLSFPLAGLLILLGGDFTRLFMKEKWHAMVPALQFFATMAIFNSLAACTVPLFRAVGRPKIVTYLMLGKLVYLAVLIYPCMKFWGITGAAAAVLFSTLLNQPFVYYQVVKILKCHYWDFLRVLFSPLMGIAAMGISITGLKHFWGTNITLGSFCLYLFAGMICYLIVFFGCDRIVGLDIKEMIREQYKILTRKTVDKE